MSSPPAPPTSPAPSIFAGGVESDCCAVSGPGRPVDVDVENSGPEVVSVDVSIDVLLLPSDDITSDEDIELGDVPSEGSGDVLLELDKVVVVGGSPVITVVCETLPVSEEPLGPELGGEVKEDVEPLEFMVLLVIDTVDSVPGTVLDEVGTVDVDPIVDVLDGSVCVYDPVGLGEVSQIVVLIVIVAVALGAIVTEVKIVMNIVLVTVGVEVTFIVVVDCVVSDVNQVEGITNAPALLKAYPTEEAERGPKGKFPPVVRAEPSVANKGWLRLMVAKQDVTVVFNVSVSFSGLMKVMVSVTVDEKISVTVGPMTVFVCVMFIPGTLMVGLRLLGMI
ncbi:hypothetical protein JX265_010560 [Neoarthrinium moseri]|uniref:Uncharacterized protein n=1 Tax=Neoarthrinium moseri TaxID=1658444 RepID=A0A9P9WDW3_9PEZI|nr:hypothetical protein JX265_010560 [Neoarthrinium moseri]